ncbi:unnamed protein product [Plutella xylostella]|uniref:(diamondback moth) hypothetical protein n=1 Tax=Plutella xylostella TaxID=51655 RepID=A0A8S4FXW5_PLUXY|nr:unnamed protein product [Plutella xylostella]
MFKEIVYLFILAFILSEARQYNVITGSWNNEVKKCASGGGQSIEYPFKLGTLESLSVKYEDLDSNTTVVASGEIYSFSQALGERDEKAIYLRDYKDEDTFKSYLGKFDYTAVCGWAKQICFTKFTLKFHKTGEVELLNYVYAASWGAVSCAETKAYVRKIEVIN